MIRLATSRWNKGLSSFASSIVDWARSRTAEKRATNGVGGRANKAIS